MRYINKILFILSFLVVGSSMLMAQESYTVNDTIFNPKLVFNGTPSKYEIAGIKVSGVDNYEDYIYRPAFNCKIDESGEVENNYYSYGENNESHARQNDCRLDAIERAIVGDDGILVTSERGLYGDEIIHIFAFFYREAKPKKLEAVLARFKKAIEDEEWVGEKYRGDIERYLFDLYIAPKTTQKT